MIELLPLSIGVGLAVSLLFSELFGLAVGGMVVPGYIGLALTSPVDVLVTLAAGLATYGLVRLLSMVMIVYGKRRTALTILVGYLIGAYLHMVPLSFTETPEGNGLGVVGFIIPGLIALWIDRQGVIETFSSLATAAVVVRLVLILFIGGELLS